MQLQFFDRTISNPQKHLKRADRKLAPFAEVQLKSKQMEKLWAASQPSRTIQEHRNGPSKQTACVWATYKTFQPGQESIHRRPTERSKMLHAGNCIFCLRLLHPGCFRVDYLPVCSCNCTLFCSPVGCGEGLAAQFI